MSILFPAIGWTIAVACLAFAAASLARAARLPKGRRLRPGSRGVRPGRVAALWCCLSAACLTGLGVLGLLQGIVVATMLAVVAVIGLRRAGRAAGAHLKAGPAWARRDLASLRGHAPRVHRAPAGDEDAKDGPPRAPRPGGPPRTVPRLREDPALRTPPRPDEIAATVTVPPPWAELAGVIAGFVAEDDNAQSAFLAGTAAGLVAVAQALGDLSETAINDIGLDPAYGNALLEVAGRVGETAGDVALADQRYHVIYGELKRAVEDGLILPHRTREWFGDRPAGGTAAA